MKRTNDGRHDWDVCVQLNLAGAVKDEVVIVAESLQLFLQPIQVIGQELHGVDEAAIRPKVKLLHHILNRHKVADVCQWCEVSAGTAHRRITPAYRSPL